MVRTLFSPDHLNPFLAVAPHISDSGPGDSSPGDFGPAVVAKIAKHHTTSCPKNASDSAFVGGRDKNRQIWPLSLIRLPEGGIAKSGDAMCLNSAATAVHSLTKGPQGLCCQGTSLEALCNGKIV